MTLSKLALGAALALGAQHTLAAESDFAAQCTALKNLKLFNVTLSKAEFVENAIAQSDKSAALTGASATAETLRPHCLVEGEIEPREGGNGRHFGTQFQLRLPQTWNNKFLYQGGGGMDGFVGQAIGSTPIRTSTAVPALQRGYAVVATDSGHQGTDATFAQDQQARIDYAYAAIGKVTHTAKQILAELYQAAPAHSFFMGCSNGGRAAMMAAQRFPTEFDGIMAGNPGFRLSRAALNSVWETNAYRAAAPKNVAGEPILANALTQQDFDILKTGVLKQCDAKDGIADGILNAWEQCDFKPEMVENELGAEKVALLNTVFGGIKNSRGEAVYASFPYDTGIASDGWRMWKLGTSQTAQPNSIFATMAAASVNHYFMTPYQPDFDLSQFNFDTDVAKTAQVAAINDAVSTDFGTFHANGGKLIIVEGVSDPVFSAHDQRDWFKQLLADDTNAPQFARLFMIPGLNHCGGGAGLGDVDPLTALENWVEHNQAPEFLVARGSTFPGKSQPICAYPKVATYIKGDENKIDSYECR